MAAAPVPASSSKAGGSGSSWSPATPSGTASGDQLLAICHSDESASGSASWTPPSLAWADVFGGPIKGGSTGGASMQAFLYPADGSEGADTGSFVRSGGSGNSGVIVVRITGADPSNPINVFATATSASSMGVCPSVTTTVANTLVLRVASWDMGKTLNAVPSGCTDIQHNKLSSNDGDACYQTETSAGATGTGTYSLSAATPIATATIAFAPPSGAATGSAALSGSGALSAAAKPAITRGASFGGAGTLSAGKVIPNGSLLDLSHWYLTEPIGDPGDPTDPLDVYEPALDSYVSATFYGDGAEAVLIAPGQGVATSGSGATRCELREMDDDLDPSHKSSWGFADGGRHTLTVTMKADPTAQTVRKSLIVGQIHDAAVPPIYLAVDFDHSPTRIQLFVNSAGVAGYLTGYTPDQDLTYRFDVHDGQVDIYNVIGEVTDLPGTPDYTYPASTFPGDETEGCFFKTGAYNKELISDGGAGRSVVRMSYLDLVNEPPPSAAFSGTGTLAAAASPAFAAAAAFGGAGTLSASGAPQPTTAATLSGAGALAAAGKPAATASAAFGGSGTLAAAATSAALGSAALSGAGSLTVAGQPAAGQSAALSGAGTLSAAGHPAAPASASLTGTGALAAAGSTSGATAAALGGSGALSASAAPAVARGAALSGSGALAAAAEPAVSAAAQLTGTGTLAAHGITAGMGDAELSGSGTLAAAALPRVPGSASLAGAGTLDASARPSGSGAAHLGGTGSLSASASPRQTAAAALSGTGQLSAAGSTQGAGATALSGAGTLTAVAAEHLSAAAALQGIGSLQAIGTPTTFAGGALSGSGALLAQPSGSGSTGSAQLAGAGTLAAAASGSAASRAAALTGTGALAAVGDLLQPSKPLTVTVSWLGPSYTAERQTSGYSAAAELVRIEARWIEEP